MSLVRLRGLVARHPGSALASFGFYNFFDIPPGISWEANLGSYSPIIHTNEVQNTDELVEKLVDKDRWRKLLWKSDPCAKNKKAIPLSKYQGMVESDNLWTVLGTDHLLEELENGELTVAHTPYCMFMRKMGWQRAVDGWLKELTREKVKNALTDIWGEDCYSSGAQHNGLFPEFNPQRSSSRQQRIIPVVCLLACVGYRLFPCFRRGEKATALGWRDTNFYYPIFGRKISKSSFVSWMVNIKRLLQMPIELKKSIGLLAVYESSRRGYKMNMQTENVLQKGREVR